MSVLDEVVTVHNGKPAALTAPSVARHGDDFAFTWQDHEATVSVDRIRENSDGLHAEVVVTVQGAEIHWGRLNLVSTSAREQLVKKLAITAGAVHDDDGEDRTVPWRPILERVCRDTVRAVRVGSPTVLLKPRKADGPAFLVEPFLPFGDTAVMFGDGGSLKGYVATTCALVDMNGLTLPGGIRFAGKRPAPVLYLDWESHAVDLEERLYGLSRGLGCRADGLHYRRMTRALSDDAATLRAEVSRLGAGLVIVDSLAPACGPEPEGADAVTRTMNDLRAFGPNVTRLVIAHVSKAGAADRGSGAKPFGSVFVWNLARSVWEVRRSEDDGGDPVVALYHRKTNRGRLHPPLGLRFTFVADGDSVDSIGLASADLAESSELLARASLPQRVRTVLASGARTAAELAEALDVSESVVSATLRRMASKTQVVRLPDTKPIQWGLAA